MTPVSSTIVCPSCQGPLTPRVLACAPCGLRIEGNFVGNEFGGLDARLLHFLRIFVHCEGRIKDMEKALGVSYPTVKAMMAELKSALGLAAAAEDEPSEPQESPAAVLDAMQRGEIPYDEALTRLKKAKKT